MSNVVTNAAEGRDVISAQRVQEKAWFKAMTPTTSIMESIDNDVMECLDLECSIKDLSLDYDANVVMDGETLKFSPRALYNLLDYAKLPMGVRDALLNNGDSDGRAIFAAAVNRGIKMHGGERDVKLRLRGTMVRAIVSDKYASIENQWVVSILNEIIQDSRITHFRYDGDTMSGLLLVPDSIIEKSDSDYSGGVHFKNSEVGTGTLVVRPSLFRSVCTNGCIFGEKKGQAFVMQRHYGSLDFKDIARRIYQYIVDYIPFIKSYMEQTQAMKSVAVGTKIDCLKVIAGLDDGCLTQKVRREWVKGWIEESKEDTSAFGLIQGLTRTGRDITDARTAVAVESLAGTLVSAGIDQVGYKMGHAVKSTSHETMIQVLSEELIESVIY